MIRIGIVGLVGVCVLAGLPAAGAEVDAERLVEEIAILDDLLER